MKIIQAGSLSLSYSPKEDRMLLTINKNQKERIDFWITRRFYFSLLFELETFLEKLGIVPGEATQKKKEKTSDDKTSNDVLPAEQYITSSLLQDLDINFIRSSNSFLFRFRSKEIEAESHFHIEEFMHFYSMLKKGFPKSEWGFI